MTQLPSLSLEEIQHSVRKNTRVLFISTDESLLRPNQQTLDGFVQVGSVFDEVHIMVLRVGASSPFPVLRVRHNTWLYTVSTDTWWWAPVPAMKLIENQLVFNDQFRPDLIVARDPFTSGVLAHWLGARYNRAVQVHLTEDYTSEKFAAKVQSPFWYRYMAKYVLKKTKSVRVPSTALEEMVNTLFPNIPDVARIPHLNNYSVLKNKSVVVDIKERYPQYRFVYVYVGELTYECKVSELLQAMRGILQNVSVGLVVLGDGPARKEFQTQCERLQIDRNVVFVNDDERSIDYFRTADVAVVLDTSFQADEMLFQAAAVGTPAVAVETNTRHHVFTHNQSVLFVPESTPAILEVQLSAILNNLALRRQLASGVEMVTKSLLHEDIDEYRLLYKQSIERAILTALPKSQTH
jgi:glycosyltransferase involved in cell wall biosynthesis